MKSSRYHFLHTEINYVTCKPVTTHYYNFWLIKQSISQTESVWTATSKLQLKVCTTCLTTVLVIGISLGGLGLIPRQFMWDIVALGTGVSPSTLVSPIIFPAVADTYISFIQHWWYIILASWPLYQAFFSLVKDVQQMLKVVVSSFFNCAH
jgi:hypothetical protein